MYLETTLQWMYIINTLTKKQWVRLLIIGQRRRWHCRHMRCFITKQMWYKVVIFHCLRLFTNINADDINVTIALVCLGNTYGVFFLLM